MIMNFIKILLFLSVFLCVSNVNGQNDIPKVSKNVAAQDFFISGKIAELKFNYIEALQNYQTALKFDSAAGIYFAIANLQTTIEKYDDALNSVVNALRKEPRNIDYLELKAFLHRVKGENKKAMETYEFILSFKPNYTYGLYSLGRIYQDVNMKEKALETYGKIIDEIGYDFDVLKRMYEIYFDKKEYENCIETLAAIIKLYPYDITYKKQLASLYQLQRKPDDAEVLYSEILAIEPNDKEVLRELTRIYFERNDLENGYLKFKKAVGKDSLTYMEKVSLGEAYYNLITQDPSSAVIAKNIFTDLNKNYPNEWIPYYFLGAIDIVNKDYVSYGQKFKTALELSNENKEALIQIGYVYYTRDNLEEAEDAIKRAVRLYPDDFQANYMYGLILQRMGDEPSAIKYYEYALAINPTDMATLSTLALAYDNQKMFKESEEMYERALKLEPDNSLILNNYAYNLSERNVELEKAYKMSKRSLEFEPNNASYLDTYGWILYRMKNYKEAEKYILKSLSFNANSSVVNDHLGDIYSAMGDKVNALKYWKIALDLDPNNSLIRSKIEMS